MLSRWEFSPLLLFALAFAPLSASAASLESVRAAAETEGRSEEAIRESAAEQAFEETYELAPPTESSGTEPNFARIFRSVHRERVGRRTVMATPKVEYGILFTGPSDYHEGEGTPMPPASTSKIFTSAFVLATLGGDYRYETRLTWTRSEKPNEGSALTFVGSGDPSITGADLPELADEYAATLRSAGIQKISGPLLFSATDARWSIKTVPEGWESEDLKSTTGFIPDSLGTLIPARVRAVFAARFARNGIQWDRSAPTGTARASFDASTSASHFSAPLRELIQPFVLHSINYKGEAFLRKVGELKGSPSAANLLDAALPLLRAFVMNTLGPNGGSTDVILNDGSGLSRTSRVTAQTMVTFLEAIKSAPYFRDFLAALPIAGESGTLQDRMSGTAAEGRVHAKTGTINGHYQLAGYLAETTATGTAYHPFAILTTTEESHHGYCLVVENEAMASLAEWMLKK